MTKKVYPIAVLLNSILLLSGYLSNSRKRLSRGNVVDDEQPGSSATANVYQSTFEKFLNLRPYNSSDNGVLFTLRPPVWTPLECVRRCRDLETCKALVVRYVLEDCWGVDKVETENLTIDNDASYFVKSYMQVPEACRSKLWTIESSTGFRLVNQASEVRAAANVSSLECSRTLVSSPPGAQARSAQFVPDSRDDYRPGEPGIVGNLDSRGKCILYEENKFTRPESFRIANEDIIYKESQCVEDLPRHIDRCSYEEYYNQTLKHYDVTYSGITNTECKDRCENASEFNCRGFTVVSEGFRAPSETQGPPAAPAVCLLHSEDTLTQGSGLLARKMGAIYHRRVTCLNVTVECGPSSMSVTYWPRVDFRGRVYANGFAERCSAPGRGQQATHLQLPFNGCGVSRAFAQDDQHGERVLMYALLVIQNNPIIQAQGDRFIRAGCVAPPERNLTLGASFSVREDDENIGHLDGTSAVPASSNINTTGSTATPRVRMYIVNGAAGQERFGEISAVALGETIEWGVEAHPTRVYTDIHVHSLVASSQLGDSSVLLLDSRGCPTGQADFPEPRRERSPEYVRLVSRFRAFRFPNSHVVKFSVMVQFCEGDCKRIICESQRSIPGRVSRSANDTVTPPYYFANETLRDNLEPYLENATVSYINMTPLKNRISKHGQIIVATSDNSGRVKEMCREINESHDSKVPLELSLIVASNDMFSADSLIYGENSRTVVAGADEARVPGSNPSMICIHEALFITITFVWLLVQILILAGCMLVIKRYRSFAEENQYQKDYHSFDNLGFESFSTNRRVHWPDQSVDILHAS